jgi:hypothetical protein
VIARQEELRERLGDIQLEKRQALERSRQMSSDPEAQAAVIKRYAPAIDDLEAEIMRLNQQRSFREKQRSDAAQLVAQLRVFLEQLPPAAQLADYPKSQPKHRDDNNYKVSVDLLRQEIAQLRQRQHTISQAPLPRDELLAKAQNFVSELAKAGRPTLVMERGEFRVEWPPGALQAAGTLGPAWAAGLAASNPAALLAMLTDQIDQIGVSGLLEAERPRQIQQLEDQISELERHEECLIAAAEEQEVIITRRPAASPWAVLGAHSDDRDHPFRLIATTCSDRSRPGQARR